MVLAQFLLLRRLGAQSRRIRSAFYLLVVAMALLALGGMPVIAYMLTSPLEGPYRPASASDLQRVEALVVMTGDRDRVPCSVRAFRKSSARQLVVTDPEYRTLALEMGLAADQVVLLPRASNTRTEAALFLETPGVRRDTAIGVVTHAWHERRTMAEIRRHFDSAVPVPCFGDRQPFGVRQLFPQAAALAVSTTMINEYLGIGWYWLSSR